MAETLKPPGQPFTFPGVARYANARFGRLLGIALLFAILPAAVIGRVAYRCWWPVISEAVEALPENGQIEGGTLQISEKDARLLAANQFLSIQLAVGEHPQANAPVDFAAQLGKYEVIMSSLLGDTAVLYPNTWNIPLNRRSLWPAWGAWKGPLLASLIVLAAIGVIASWFGLAVLYAPIALALGGVAGRNVNFAKAWKMSVAAQWPASLLMTFAIALYSTGEIGLLFVLIMFAAHFIPSILNILIAPLCVEKANPVLREKSASGAKENPFATEKSKKRSARNPFQGMDD